jgi:hypothetical protein
MSFPRPFTQIRDKAAPEGTSPESPSEQSRSAEISTTSTLKVNQIKAKLRMLFEPHLDLHDISTTEKRRATRHAWPGYCGVHGLRTPSGIHREKAAIRAIRFERS